MKALAMEFCLDPPTHKDKVKENETHKRHVHLVVAVGLVGVFVFAKCPFFCLFVFFWHQVGCQSHPLPTLTVQSWRVSSYHIHKNAPILSCYRGT